MGFHSQSFPLNIYFMTLRIHALVLVCVVWFSLARRSFDASSHASRSLSGVLLALSGERLRPSNSRAVHRLVGSPCKFLQCRAHSRIAMLEDESSRKDTSERAKIRAQRLALEAERAALEAEKLELELSQMRAEAVEKYGVIEEKSTAQPPEPSPAPAASLASSNKITELRADAIETQTVRRLRQLVDGKENEELQLNDTQIAAARELVFTASTFPLTEVSQTPVGTIFRGKLRFNASIVVERVLTQAAQSPLLKDVSFSLLQDPYQYIESVSEEPEIVFLALQKAVAVKRQKIPELVLGSVSLLSNLLTTTALALAPVYLAAGGDIDVFLDKGLDVTFLIALGFIAVQVIHEVAHFATAKANDIDVGIPIFLPSPWLGTITKIRSFPITRTALFDFAAAGPIAAGTFSLVLFVIGLVFSGDLPAVDAETIQGTIEKTFDALAATTPETGTSAADSVLSGIASTATSSGVDPALSAAATGFISDVGASSVIDPALSDVAATATTATGLAANPATAASSTAQLGAVVPSNLFRDSLLLGTIARTLLPTITDSPFVSVSPLVLIGFYGVYVNALQLFPFGRTDGGRMQTAAFGRKRHIDQSNVLQFLILLGFLFNAPYPFYFVSFLVWHVYAFQGRVEFPCVDDITGVDSKRQLVNQIAGLVAVLTLVPVLGTPDMSNVFSDINF